MEPIMKKVFSLSLQIIKQEMSRPPQLKLSNDTKSGVGSPPTWSHQNKQTNIYLNTYVFKHLSSHTYLKTFL
jgi:hypothetical protein